MHGDSASPSSDLGAKDRPFNHLSREKSPYLRQHARNPVDWYPWGEEAFRRAVDEDKPIFLSIGYATCHWCHVMARESFEDDAVAAILNEHFITIKVDREERPDIDRVYMMVCQQMTGQGGWPLTVFLTPQKEPFFAGTYFPRSARGGMTGLLELLPRIVSLWKEQRGDLELSAQKITLALGRTTAHLSKGTIDTYLLTRGYEDLAARFDPVNGGFGRAPKFPTPTMLFFLLRYWKRTGSAPALKMVQETLGAIRCGGIHDHLGGGFHRYSTDAGWQVPHFEKMLYDQALLIMAFTEAWQATKKQDYLDTAEGIASYLLRDLQSAEGGFISAEDADNDEGEGAYYVWTREEFDSVLGRKDGAFAAGVFGVTETGNFMVPESGRRANVLFLDCQAAGGVPVGDQSRVERIRTLLFAARDQRPRPPRDDKVLTDWNGLGIAALAQLFRVSGNRIYLTAAERAMHFVLSQLKNPDSGLFHRYCDGEAGILAFADDYAFTIQALIELYESGFEPWYLKEATRLENFVTAHFHDPLHGGYFTTPAGSDPLIIRTKETSDGATPSCNSVMLENLVRLGHLTGDFTFHERASDLAATIARQAAESLSAHTAYLCGLDHLLGPSTIIVITGDSRAADLPEMIQQIWQMYLPSATILCKTPEISSGLDTIAPFTRTMIARDGRATAYICHGTTCSAPVTRIEDLISQLAGNKER